MSLLLGRCKVGTTLNILDSPTRSKQLVTKPERVYVDAISGEVVRTAPLTMNCVDPLGHRPPEKITGSKPYTERDYTTLAKNLFVPGTFIPLNTGTDRFGTNPLTFETESIGSENQLSVANTGLNTRIFQNPGRQVSSITEAWDLSPNTRISNTDNWGTQAQRATTAHWLMQRTTDFWRTRFLRNGINNNAQTPFLPHVLVEMPGDLNAGWDGIASIGYFNQIGAAPWIVADISAHEYYHAITQATCNLEYEGQSGAINESLSDIFGTAFERHMFPNGAPGQWNWTIGDDVFIVRSMIDPPSIAQGRDQNNQPIFQPDRFQGPNWRPIVPPCGRDNDDCWVHVNSGVMNKWFHTLNTEQGPVGRTTPAVGFDDAINIVYDAQRYYLNRFSNYQDVAWATRLAASVLYNECSPQQRSVIAAWRAVDVPVNNCDGECDFAMGDITVTGSQACNQAITISAGCNGPGCAGVTYFIYPPNNGTLSTNNPATFTTPSVAGTYLYQASLFKYRFSPSTCFSNGSSCQIPITCAGGNPCDFSSGPRYVGTWYGLTVQIRSISGKNVLVTAISGSPDDKYYPRGDNFWGSFDLDPNAANLLQGCLNAGGTGYDGLVIPGGISPPSGMTKQGFEQDGAAFYSRSGTPPTSNPCDFNTPRQVGTWNGLNVQIHQFANGKRTLVTHVPGSSNDKYYPRGDNFWDNFTKNGDADQYRPCLNMGITDWYGLAFPGGISPPSGYRQGAEQDGAVFFSTNGARVGAETEPTPETVALVHVRPNPAQDELTVTFLLKETGSAQVRLLDLQGRVQQQHTYKGVAGQNERVLRVGSLATGLYAVEVSFEGQRVIQKLVKE